MLYALKTTFILVKNITSKVVLGSPFLALLYPFRILAVKKQHVLGQEVKFQFLLALQGKDHFTKQYSISKHIDTIKRENNKEVKTNKFL